MVIQLLLYLELYLTNSLLEWSFVKWELPAKRKGLLE